MIAMLFFLLMSPAILKIWETDHAVRAEVHRDVFHKLTTPVHAGDDGRGNLVAIADTLWGAQNTVSAPAKLAGKHYVANRRFGGRITFGQTVSGVISLPNTFVEGWEGKKFNYGNKATIEGEMEISRTALAIRPPWTRPDWPYVSTQITLESATVEAWYRDREKEAMAFWQGSGAPYGDIKIGLKLQDTFYTFLWASIKDEIAKRVKERLRLRKKSKPPPATKATPTTPPMDTPTNETPETVEPGLPVSQQPVDLPGVQRDDPDP